MENGSILLEAECTSIRFFPEAHHIWILWVVFIEYVLAAIFTLIKITRLVLVFKHTIQSLKVLFVSCGLLFMLARSFPLIVRISDPSLVPPDYLRIFLVCNELPLVLQYLLLVLFVLFLLNAFNFISVNPTRSILPISAFTLLATILISVYSADLALRRGESFALKVIDGFNIICFTLLFITISTTGFRVFNGLSQLSIPLALKKRIFHFKLILYTLGILQLIRSIWSILLFIRVNVFQSQLDSWIKTPERQHYYFIVFLIWSNLFEILPWLVVLFLIGNSSKQLGRNFVKEDLLLAHA
ncbi:hypothetical protein P9112_010179 [Eukaryota sp. TZLM1-RC]